MNTNEDFFPGEETEERITSSATIEAEDELGNPVEVEEFTTTDEHGNFNDDEPQEAEAEEVENDGSFLAEQAPVAIDYFLQITLPWLTPKAAKVMGLEYAENLKYQPKDFELGAKGRKDLKPVCEEIIKRYFAEIKNSSTGALFLVGGSVILSAMMNGIEKAQKRQESEEKKKKKETTDEPKEEKRGRPRKNA